MSQSSSGRANNTLLSPNDILKLVNTHYSLGEAQYCDLIRRGFNDHYLVEFEEAKYIFRVYLDKYYIESPDAFQFELDLLEHLHNEGIPVAHALRKADGELLGWTSTALGERAFALFSYAAGEEVTHDIIHGDLHSGNIRFEGDQVTFFDFDHCAYGWRAYDVGPMSFLPEAKFEKIMEGYESVRPLSEGERASLPVFAKLRRLWDIGDMLATTSLRA